MLQRLNNWGRKSLIAVVVLAVTAISLIGSPEVPGKVMALTGFDLPGVHADFPRCIRDNPVHYRWNCYLGGLQ